MKRRDLFLGLALQMLAVAVGLVNTKPTLIAAFCISSAGCLIWSLAVIDE